MRTGIRDGKNSDSGSGLEKKFGSGSRDNIPDPQHWSYDESVWQRLTPHLCLPPEVRSTRGGGRGGRGSRGRGGAASRSQSWGQRAGRAQTRSQSRGRERSRSRSVGETASLSFCRFFFAFSILQGSVADPNPDPPDPHVFGPPGSGSICQRYGSGSGSGSFYPSITKQKKVRKTLIPTAL